MFRRNFFRVCSAVACWTGFGVPGSQSLDCDKIAEEIDLMLQGLGASVASVQTIDYQETVAYRAILKVSGGSTFSVCVFSIKGRLAYPQQVSTEKPYLSKFQSGSRLLSNRDLAAIVVDEYLRASMPTTALIRNRDMSRG